MTYPRPDSGGLPYPEWPEILSAGGIPVLPTTDSGYATYGAGRLFLPAGTCLCADPQGTAGTFWPADGAHNDWFYNQALPIPIPDQPLITKCAQVVNDGTAENSQTANITVVASTSYNDSIYVYAPTLGGNLTITSETGHSFTVAALTGASSGWTRYSVQAATVAGEVTKYLKFAFAGGTASTVYVTGYNPIASAVLTPYGDGSYSGWSWSGAAHASTSVRAVSSLYYESPDSMLNAFVDSGGTVGLSWTPLFSKNAPGTINARLFQLYNSAHSGNAGWRGYASASTLIVLKDDGTATDISYFSQNWVSGTPQSQVWRYSPTTMDLMVGGVNGTQVSTTKTLPAIQRIYVGGVVSTQAQGYVKNMCFVPSRITDAETVTLDAMLTAGATGLELFRWFRDKGYRNTLILPLQSDSVGYLVP